MGELVFTALGSFLAQSPVFLVWLAGLVWAIMRWQQHPHVSLFALIGLAILLLDSSIGLVLNVQLPQFFSEWGWSAAEIGRFFMIKGFIQAMLAAIGYGLWLIALFGWRTSQVDPTI